MIITRAVFAGLTAAVLLSGAASAGAGDEAAIRSVMMVTWDRPDSPLEAGPIVTAEGYAVADWTQGEMGGRALLVLRDAAWSVAFCGGDGLRSAETLVRLGVPAQAAKTLERDLAAAETTITSDRLAAMASFAGLVEMRTEPHPN